MLVRRQATIDTIRAGINGLRAEDSITVEMWQGMKDALDQTIEAMDRQIDFITDKAEGTAQDILGREGGGTPGGDSPFGSPNP